MALLKEIDQLIKSSDTEDGGLDQARDQLRQALREIGPFLAGTDTDALECAARDLALSLARTYIGRGWPTIIYGISISDIPAMSFV